MVAYLKTKPVFPIFIPDYVSLDSIEPLCQEGNSCSVFACSNALLTMQHFAGRGIGFNALDLYKELLAQKYTKYDPRKSVSVPAVLNLMKEKLLIKKYRTIQNAAKDYKIKLYQGYPIISVIQEPRRSHAVCTIKYDKDLFMAYNSNTKGGYIPLPEFQYIKNSYIIHLT